MVETWFSRDMSSRASSRGRDHVALPLEYGGKRSAPNQSPRRGNKLPWSGRLPITHTKISLDFWDQGTLLRVSGGPDSRLHAEQSEAIVLGP